MQAALLIAWEVSRRRRDVAAKTEKISKRLAQEEALLDELKTAAKAAGYQVRHEKLLREVGYRVRSGSCRVRDLRLILLDRTLPAAAQIDILVDELAAQPLDDVYLSPAVRRLLERTSNPVAVDA